MKIALMTNNYKPFMGGVPISVERLAKSLINQGHDVTVFAPTYQGYVDTDEVKVVRYASFLQKFIGGIVLPNPLDPVIEAEFRKQAFDVIHVHHPMLIGRTATYLSKKYGVPLVFTYHTRYEQYVKSYAKSLPFVDQVMPYYLHTFMKHCDHLIAPTKGMKEYLWQLGYDNRIISVLPTGIEDKHFQVSEEEKREIRARYQAKKIPLFISVSRMANEKNVAFLLRSIAVFKERYGKPFRLLMIGDGPGREAYQELTEKLSIDKEVSFTGKIANENIAPYFAAADAFLFASKTETQGIVILEAFAGGTPVIALNATGVRDLVEHGENGFLCQENEIAFADHLVQLMNDAVLQRKFSQNATKSAMDYREEAVAKKAAALYNRVIAEYQLQHNFDRKERAYQWNGNITF